MGSPSSFLIKQTVSVSAAKETGLTACGPWVVSRVVTCVHTRVCVPGEGVSTHTQDESDLDGFPFESVLTRI